MTLKVLSVVGARPQFIKAAPVSRAIESHPGLNEVMVHTGQHFDEMMSDVFFRELDLAMPDYNLAVAGGTHAEMTARMLEKLEPVMVQERPDWVLVYGDTNSTLAAALTASKLNLPIAHVEAGLRSFNRTMPEEINRVVTDHLSRALYCPTKRSLDWLKHEGITDRAIFVGDVMYDASLWAQKRTQDSLILSRLSLAREGYALATVHRADNTDSPQKLSAIIDYLMSEVHQGPILWPVHPRIAELLPPLLPDDHSFMLIEPLGYLDMAALLQNCREVFTDSGGLQKEAYFYKRPCTTLRSETEWPETIEAGWNRLWTDGRWCPRTEIADYGSGDAALRIAEDLACAP